MATRLHARSASPSRLRRDREKEETRQLILEAARELFTEEGYAQTSMRKIADKIGYTATAIYHHFADKDALLNELCAHDFRALGEALQKVGQLPDPVSRIRAMGVNYVRFAVTHPEQFRFMFMVDRPVPGPEDVRMDPAEDGYAFLLANVTEALKAKKFRSELKNAELLAQVLWASVHGIATIHVSRVASDEKWVTLQGADATARVMIDALLRGLLSPKQQT